MPSAGGLREKISVEKDEIGFLAESSIIWGCLMKREDELKAVTRN
jgi:hypothetical protein